MVHACSSLVLPCVFMVELDAGTNLKGFSFRGVDFPLCYPKMLGMVLHCGFLVLAVEVQEVFCE